MNASFCSPSFLKKAFLSTDRALNLMDRNTHSKTFGCFDKYYWHFKTKDFPSASFQMGVEFLSRLWANPYTDNPFYKSPLLLSWIKAGLKYSCSIQHKDGSFDEWYPNERGWAGPSSYVIHALIRSYSITEKELDEDLKKELRDCFSKTGDFLIKQKEGAKLANHSALFLLSLYELSEVLCSQKLKAQFEISFQNFESLVSKEGWSMEYDNVDFGYNLATLSFFARLNKLYPHSFLKNYAEKSFSFLSYFFYPDGSFGALGSRETIHLYPYAFKYWSQTLPLAGQLYQHLQNKKAFEKLKPSDQDDHYLFYRLCDYLEADEIKDPPQTTNAPAFDKAPQKSFLKKLPCYSEKSFQKHFPLSGFFIKKSDSFYFVSHLKKGGAFRLYNDTHSLKNNGWILQQNNKKLTNFWPSNKNQFSIKDNSLSLEGKSAVLKQKYFNRMSFILFRIVSFSALHYKIAYFLKKGVRKLLILQKKPVSWSYKRSFQFEKDQVIIKDNIRHGRKAEKLFYGGIFSARYVPQSSYFELSDLQNPTRIFKIPPNKTESLITQVFDLKNSQVKEKIKSYNP